MKKTPGLIKYVMPRARPPSRAATCGAEGESGGKSMPSRRHTTMALGEEAGAEPPEPPVTTLAVGEEGGSKPTGSKPK